MKTDKLIRLLLAFALCFGAAGLGSVVTAPSIGGWYADLVKPPFNIPNWIFGPVWAVLYSFMALAFWIVWNSKTKKKEKGMLYFYIQLILNTLWSLFFFGLRLPALALAGIMVLWIMIYFTKREFYKISHTAGWLFVPYLVWVSFAMVLNASIVLLN